MLVRDSLFTALLVMARMMWVVRQPCENKLALNYSPLMAAKRAGLNVTYEPGHSLDVLSHGCCMAIYALATRSPAVLIHVANAPRRAASCPRSWIARTVDNACCGTRVCRSRPQPTRSTRAGTAARVPMATGHCRAVSTWHSTLTALLPSREAISSRCSTAL